MSQLFYHRTPRLAWPETGRSRRSVGATDETMTSMTIEEEKEAHRGEETTTTTRASEDGEEAEAGAEIEIEVDETEVKTTTTKHHHNVNEDRCHPSQPRWQKLVFHQAAEQQSMVGRMGMAMMTAIDGHSLHQQKP